MTIISFTIFTVGIFSLTQTLTYISYFPIIDIIVLTITNIILIFSACWSFLHLTGISINKGKREVKK